MKSWKNMELFGASGIERVRGEYQVWVPGPFPGAKFKVKVLERTDGTFLAVSNVCFRSFDGSTDGQAGMGRTEVQALEDLLSWFMAELQSRDGRAEGDFEWSDPQDF